MASMGGGSNLDWEQAAKLLKTPGMIVKVLQTICAAEGLSKHGVKADLHNRITERLKYLSNNHLVAQFERLRSMLANPSSISPASPAQLFGNMANSSPSPAVTPSAPYTASAGNNFNMATGMNGFRAHGHQNFEFKPSPFYQIQQQLGETKECLTMTAHRHSVSLSLRVIDHPILSRVANDPRLRVMAFCAAEGKGRQDIAFPQQSEIKVNGGDIKANLRGLKNKPGSTRPVDITKDLRLKVAAYNNNVELTYALTNKKFYFLIFVVHTIPVADLVARLETGKRLTKDSVVSEMVNNARDADIVATASVLSLKCPLSTLRIDLPVRSISCRHNQCFDATSYLQLQEQGPTWLCPICNTSAPFETLAIDEYVNDILRNTSKSISQVTIQPNGQWELHNKPSQPSKLNGFASDDDDDDLVEITKSGDNLKMGTPRANGTPIGVQLSVSREQSTTSSAPPQSSSSTSGKRPRPTVIDLTLSGDEDEEPIARAPKRQFSGYGLPVVPPVYRPATSASPRGSSHIT